MVSAGAGWGKTLAAAHWASAVTDAGPVAWVSLTESDNEPRSFWAYVVAALAGTGIVPPEHPLAQLVPGLGDENELMTRLLAELATLPTTVVLVLDDFHVIREPGVHQRLTAAGLPGRAAAAPPAHPVGPGAAAASAAAERPAG